MLVRVCEGRQGVSGIQGEGDAAQLDNACGRNGVRLGADGVAEKKSGFREGPP